MKSTYYFDNSTATLVRHRVSIWVMTSDEPTWYKLAPDNSYEREIYLGQGNNCLWPLSPEEVLDILNKWHFKEVSDWN